MEDDLIYDDGELRNCPANKAKIGYWKTCNYFHSYRDVIRTYARLSKDNLWAMREGMHGLISLVVSTILLPITPPIRAYIDYRRSVKEVKKESE